MSVLSKHHKELNEDGIGKCSVPMWCQGMPAGFCDKEAYGEREKCKEWFNHAQQEWMREDGKYNGYIVGLACPCHGGVKTRVFKDGNMYCAVYPDFKNLQESPCGFGKTPEEARKELSKEQQQTGKMDKF